MSYHVTVLLPTYVPRCVYPFAYISAWTSGLEPAIVYAQRQSRVLNCPFDGSGDTRIQASMVHYSEESSQGTRIFESHYGSSAHAGILTLKQFGIDTCRTLSGGAEMEGAGHCNERKEMPHDSTRHS